jgi:methylmalonyl-CoA mutase
MSDLSAEAKALANYRPTHKVRFVTAASLFDGHDAAINIMRRILQGMGAEVIHLGHNRSVDEVVTAALQEDAQGIAISSYQGGHVEYFKYMVDLLKQRGGAHIQVFGGGGGVIVPSEIAELQGYGVTRIYSPEDGHAGSLARPHHPGLARTGPTHHRAGGFTGKPPASPRTACLGCYKKDTSARYHRHRWCG